MTIFLYVKTHNITKLKYFGKTTSADPVSYSGSGTYWLRHLAIHGKDFSTEIVGAFEDIATAKVAASEFCKANNIVESDEWANLKIEDITGGWDHITRQHLLKGVETFRNRPIEEQRIANAKRGRSGELNSMFGRDRSGKNNPRYGVKLSQEQRSQQSKAMIGRRNAQDKDGKTVNVLVDDPRFKTGELTGLNKGKIVVYDENGQTRYIHKSDPKFLDGTFSHVNKGRVASDKTKNKIAAAVRNKKWFNNGEVSIRRITCPDDSWKPGRLIKNRS